MRCLVAAGIEVATGELLRTMETVAGERLRCPASIFSVAGLSASGSFLFSCHCDGCARYRNTCTPFARPAPSEEIGYENFALNKSRKNYKRETKSKLPDDIVLHRYG